ncbi:hypothetical protein ASPBRDRAFT_577252 [Aspergillus brasiliensis CBS 101740]|uniref:Uncharacterized protein n=1 Tax=Aspergillus brasiliensis (strain CBS 101740 / IMI 381727 / IBT 21946) TaxID=767769 RepID=A0A1L9UJF6_ASPBC|nr:hypothetical protein ASPBRDRAFT_577252 [Aspergillus brasiliensis CBS 101740]
MPVDDGLFIAAPRCDCLQIVVGRGVASVIDACGSLRAEGRKEKSGTPPETVSDSVRERETNPKARDIGESSKDKISRVASTFLFWINDSHPRSESPPTTFLGGSQRNGLEIQWQ